MSAPAEMRTTRWLLNVIAKSRYPSMHWSR